MTIENENTVTLADDGATIAVKTAEQLASERNLDLAIGQDEQAENAAPGQAQNAAPVIDAVIVVKEVLTVVPMGLHMAGLKNAAAAWSDDACGSISAALVPVLRKYAFGQRILGYLESGGGVAEGVLLMAVWPVAAATYAGYLQDQAEKEPKPVNDDMQAGKVYEAGTEKGSTFKYNEYQPL